MKIIESILIKVIHEILPDIETKEITDLLRRYHEELKNGTIHPEYTVIDDIILNDLLPSNRQIININSKQRLTEIIMKNIPNLTTNQTYSMELIDNVIHIKIFNTTIISQIDYISKALSLHDHYKCSIGNLYYRVWNSISLLKKYCKVEYDEVIEQ